MADRVSPEVRSRIMRAIKGKDTKPELAMASALKALGVRFSRHAKLPGSPDFALRAVRLAVFVHGCFWHRCPRHFKAPQTRTEAWRLHFARNVRRDRRVRRRLLALGWHTMVVWEHVPAGRAALRVLRRAGRLAGKVPARPPAASRARDLPGPGALPGRLAAVAPVAPVAASNRPDIPAVR